MRWYGRCRCTNLDWVKRLFREWQPRDATRRQDGPASPRPEGRWRRVVGAAHSPGAGHTPGSWQPSAVSCEAHGEQHEDDTERDAHSDVEPDHPKDVGVSNQIGVQYGIRVLLDL